MRWWKNKTEGSYGELKMVADTDTEANWLRSLIPGKHFQLVADPIDDRSLVIKVVERGAGVPETEDAEPAPAADAPVGMTKDDLLTALAELGVEAKQSERKADLMRKYQDAMA